MKTKLLSLIFGLLSACAVFSQSTNPPVMQTPRVRADDHQTSFLRWSAVTGGVYQVESADAFGAVGNQGLNWIIRETDAPARGTNAEWVDFGDSRWIPRIVHPIFQPHRFYRVTKVKQASMTPPTVSLSVRKSGSVLPAGTNAVGGNIFVAVNVTVTDTNQQLSSVRVFVDGQQTHSVVLPGSTNYINTTEWPNGIHEIYAVATTMEFAETIPASDAATATNATRFGLGIGTSKFLNFSNYISQFFIANPYFQGGQTQEVLAAFDADSNWRLRIVDFQETTVRQYTGVGTSLYAAWDGNDQFGTPLSYGFYDYIIEARPSEFGPLGAAGAGSFAAAGGSSDPDPTATYRRTTGAMQFSRTNTTVTENLVIPSLNPTNNNTAGSGGAGGGSPPAPGASSSLASEQLESTEELSFPTSSVMALANGWTSYFTPPPPMPPVRVNGKWHPFEDVYGPLPWNEVKISLSTQEKFLAGGNVAMLANNAGESAAAAAAAWPDTTYTTRTPTRPPGSLFFGYAGTVGVGFQGHHPKPEPYYALPSGGVISLSRPPYGPLVNASTIANNFANDMASGGWRTSFLLGNDNFGSIDLASLLGPGSGTSRFAQRCNFGLIVGHMTASQQVDPNYAYSSVSYFPFYKSTANVQHYEWVGLPGMDLGDGSVFSKLRWMAMYGCNSLREADFSDMWTKFVLPMPPNLRLLLGSEDGVYIDPRVGPLFAGNLNGWTTPDGQPMSIFDAWADADGYAFAQEGARWWRHPLGLGTRSATAVYRDITQEGSWSTLNDSIWGWGTDISFDWFDVSFISRVVYQ